MATQRIEYIDAMRGFTMILVVYSHICRYCLGDWTMGWNDVFFLFRLPCFFFISGWLFDVLNRPAMEIIRHKFMVQIVPTVIFLLLLAPPPLFFSRLGATKGGYWFTFALFEFFVLHILNVRYLNRGSAIFAIAISIAAFCYDVYYNRYFSEMGWVTDALGFLSFMTWRYYLFFYIGTWVKRHFDAFLLWTGKPWVMTAVVAGFILIAWNPRSENVALEYLIFAVGGILGMTMVFNFFRYLGSCINGHPSFHFLSYIGTRTLDIYLLHYFVLPRFLLFHTDWLRAYDSRLMEFFVALALALVVIAVCLFVSYVVRLSPFLGHYLFGVKYERKA